MDVNDSHVIQTKNLNLFYGEKQAVKNIDMNLALKEVTAIIGPSGC